MDWWEMSDTPNDMPAEDEDEDEEEEGEED